MAESKITTHPTIREGFDNERVIFSAIAHPLDRSQKFQILAEVPKAADGLEAVETFLKERYDCDLDTAIAAAVRQFFTRPDYHGHVCDFEIVNGKRVYGDLKPEYNTNEKIHEAYQDLIDNYRCGTKREPGKAAVVKAKANKLDNLDAMAKKLGYASAEEFMAAQATE
jgi:hypothetical protein